MAVHEFAQLLAGWVPDEKLAALRQTLAGGQPSAAVAAAIAMVTEHDVPLLAEDIDAARALVGEPGALTDVRPVPAYPPLPFWFSAAGPDECLAEDQVIGAAAQAHSAQIAGVWRAWRLPRGAMWPGAAIAAKDVDRAHPVYIVQVPGSDVAPTLAGELQAALAGHGDAGVEVIALDAALRPYQAAALGGSALLWVAQDEEPSFKIAKVFDFAKPDTGPGFHPGHRVITDSAERDRLLWYLMAGTPVVHSTARTRDVLNPEAGQVVPTGFRTDGEWIWADTVAYYLQQHGVAPDEDLATHIDARYQAGEANAETDDETAAVAANFLLHPPPEHARKAAWTPGADG